MDFGSIREILMMVYTRKYSESTDAKCSLVVHRRHYWVDLSKTIERSECFAVRDGLETVP
jgi:hypothetical protein